MSQLGNPARIKRMTVQSQASGDNLIYLDNIRLETPNSNPAARIAAPSAEAPIESRMLVSPNPTDGPVKVQVWAGEAQAATLTVLSATGQPVYFQPVQARPEPAHSRNLPGTVEYRYPAPGTATGTYEVIAW